MKTLRYLAYGSNLHPWRLQQRVPSARLLDTAALIGWQLKFHKRGQDASAKCNMIKTGKTVDVAYGAMYEMLASEKHQLDKVEGLHAGYHLAQTEIAEIGSVFFYVAEETYIDNDLLPFGWYKDLVMAGGRFHAFPRAYLAQIASVKTVVDTDKLRHQRNLAILQPEEAIDLGGI